VLLKGLSFTETAKIVGEKWQVLPGHKREAYERQAFDAQERHRSELAEYRRTTYYEIYQKYLEDFKAVYPTPLKGDFASCFSFPCSNVWNKVLIFSLKGKRSRPWAETSVPVQSSHDHYDVAARGRLNLAATDPSAPGNVRLEPSLLMSLACLPAGLLHPAKLTSPAIDFPSGVKSSWMVNCCPVCASRLVDMHKEEAFGVSTSHPCPPAACVFSHY
jgi:hypothetical protein